jgi:alkanesulfonate monooxygenase SsuD/methylene tetrahydromethanopterin reductase-like flavin-dependent oxidoreductase (luciferase family)
LTEVKIGVASFSGQRLDGEIETHGDIIRNCLALAMHAESVGLDSVWITEHHFLPTGHVGSVVAFAAAMGAVTSRIAIGVYALAPRYEPVQLAEDAVFVDQLTGGRFRLGLILGYRDVEYMGFGVSPAERVSRMEEVAQIVRLCWAAGPVVFEGSRFRRKGFEVYPKPATSVGIPLLIGGHHPNAFDRAARLGEGFIMDAGTDSDVFAKEGHNRDLYARVETAVRLYRAALSAHGKSFEEAAFYMTIGGFLAPGGPNEAWDLVEESYMYTRRTYGEWYGIPEATYTEWYPGRMSTEERQRRRAEILLGAPQDIIPVLDRVRQIVGDNLHVIFRCNYPGMPMDATRESIRLVGQVHSHFSD